MHTRRLGSDGDGPLCPITSSRLGTCRGFLAVDMIYIYIYISLSEGGLRSIHPFIPTNNRDPDLRLDTVLGMYAYVYMGSSPFLPRKALSLDNNHLYT